MPFSASKLPKSSFATRFGNRSRAISPSDSTDLDPYPKAIVALTSGNLVVIPAKNADVDTVTFTGIQAGFSPPFVVRRVKLTGTTATVATIED